MNLVGRYIGFNTHSTLLRNGSKWPKDATSENSFIFRKVNKNYKRKEREKNLQWTVMEGCIDRAQPSWPSLKNCQNGTF